MAHITLEIVEDDEWGEWVVKYYRDGEYLEGPTAYQSDFEDAMDTAKAMEDEAIEQGHTVNIEYDEDLAGDYLSNPGKRELDIDQMVDLYKRHRDLRVVGDILGVPETTVHLHLFHKKELAKRGLSLWDRKRKRKPCRPDLSRRRNNPAREGSKWCAHCQTDDHDYIECVQHIDIFKMAMASMGRPPEIAYTKHYKNPRNCVVCNKRLVRATHILDPIPITNEILELLARRGVRMVIRDRDVFQFKVASGIHLAIDLCDNHSVLRNQKPKETREYHRYRRNPGEGGRRGKRDYSLDAKNKARQLYQNCKYVTRQGKSNLSAVARELGLSPDVISNWKLKGLLGPEPKCSPSLPAALDGLLRKFNCITVNDYKDELDLSRGNAKHQLGAFVRKGLLKKEQVSIPRKGRPGTKKALLYCLPATKNIFRLDFDTRETEKQKQKVFELIDRKKLFTVYDYRKSFSVSHPKALGDLQQLVALKIIKEKIVNSPFSKIYIYYDPSLTDDEFYQAYYAEFLGFIRDRGGCTTRKELREFNKTLRKGFANAALSDLIDAGILVKYKGPRGEYRICFLDTEEYALEQYLIELCRDTEKSYIEIARITGQSVSRATRYVKKYRDPEIERKRKKRYIPLKFKRYHGNLRRRKYPS